MPREPEINSTISLRIRIDWLACKDECVPGKAELVCEILVAAEGRPSAQAATADSAWAALPVPAPAGAVALTWQDDSVRIEVDGARRLEFYPFQDCLEPSHLIQDGAAEGESLILRLGEAKQVGAVKGILHQVMADGTVRNWTIDFSNET